MPYVIQACRVATLSLKGKYAFARRDPDGSYPYSMYVWLIQGEGRTILVDTGPKSIDVINQGLRELCVEPVRQAEDETLPAVLRRAGVHPTDIAAVILTHGHYDHVSNLDLFPDCPIIVNRRGWERAVQSPGPWPGEVYFPLLREWNHRLRLVENEELYPGIRSLWVGGHTLCSQAVIVDTPTGEAIIAGDVVSLYENLERDEPIGVYEDLDQLYMAMAAIRARDAIVIPSHDPTVLERHPGGLVGLR